MAIRKMFADIRRRREKVKTQKFRQTDKGLRMRGFARMSRLIDRGNIAKKTSKGVQDVLRGDTKKEGLIAKGTRPFKNLREKLSIKNLGTNLAMKNFKTKMANIPKNQKIAIGVGIAVLAIASNYVIRRKAQTTLSAVGKLI
jgi:hypothetical protein